MLCLIFFTIEVFAMREREREKECVCVCVMVGILVFIFPTSCSLRSYSFWVLVYFPL